MNLAVHPLYPSKITMTWVCDDFLFTDQGVEHLHKSPQKIFEVGV
jgi:hypothetical protein